MVKYLKFEVILLLLTACALTVNGCYLPFKGEDELTVDMDSAPFNDWGSASVTMNLPESTGATLILSLLPTNTGELRQERFEVDLEGGVSETISTEARIDTLGKIQIMAMLVTSGGSRYNSQVTIWMTNLGGTVYPAGEKFIITPPAIVPTVEVFP